MPDREEIKRWLKKQGITREELGKEMGVSKGTVNNWLSGADPIPQVKLAYIERMMSEDIGTPAHTKTSAADFKTFPVLLANEDYERCLHAADAAGLSVSDWAADICAAEAAEFIKKEQQADTASTQSNSSGVA